MSDHLLCRSKTAIAPLAVDILVSIGGNYAGGAAWPEARYGGGNGSDFRRKTSYSGEQQIYVDPRYGGRETTPLGLDPFRVTDGVLSIVATRTPPGLKALLFNNEYTSGTLTTQSRFSQKYGYFEIRAKVPVGTGGGYRPPSVSSAAASTSAFRPIKSTNADRRH